MPSTPFKNIVDAVVRMGGMDPTRDLSAVRFAAITEYVNQRLEEGWKYEFWPALTLTDQRYYRPQWSVTEAVTKTTERFFLPAMNYYQALQASTGQAPAIYTNGVWKENSAYWATSTAQYSASVWLPNTAYGVNGDGSGLPYQVQNPNDGLSYQCIAAHTSGATFDATKWGVLTPLNKYVPFVQTGLPVIGEVKLASRRNPLVNTNNPGLLNFVPSNNGVQFDWRAPVTVWLTYRPPVPQFTSTIRLDSATYAVGTSIYDTATRDCWTATAAITAGQSPTTTPSSWSRILFPDFLGNFVKRAAFADVCRDQKQDQRADDELNQAYEELAAVQDRILSAQGQYDTASVVAYGGGSLRDGNYWKQQH